MKRFLKILGTLFTIYVFFIILYVVSGLTRCSYGIIKTAHEASYLPSEKACEEELQKYLSDRYHEDFIIPDNATTLQKGEHYYRIVRFHLKNDNSDTPKTYEAYVTYTSKKDSTPIIVCDNYYIAKVEPILKEYLDEQYGQKATKLNLLGQIDCAEGCAAEVPIIKTPEEAEEFIQKYKIDFTYIIFNRTDAEQLKENINSTFSQYSDDYVQIRIISGYSDDIQNEIDNSLKLGEEIKVPTASSSYDETVIKSDIYK